MRKIVRNVISPFRVAGRTKIFCIGLNKTGTTSLEKALKCHGIVMGDQNEGQRLMAYYYARDFKPIVSFCRSAQGFQDAPFSCKHLYVTLHQAYPLAKFILTKRPNEEEWYNSLIKFHTKKFGRGGQLPTCDDLKLAKRPFNRTVYNNMKLRFNVSDNDIYNKDILTEYYLSHNNAVEDYFRENTNFLVLDVKDNDAYLKFCRFLDFQPILNEFPWENKT